ncbi:MAG: hypothetical protein CK427_02455 [Leptospira sp.]|nr:MAG: hypothetical protein CK427_02455 [Leptospira sp.]
MVKIISYIFAFLIMLNLFFVSASSITSAKLVELRLNIQKDQIMNYELSSKALKSKLRQIFLDKDNFNNEIKINILESSILNSNIQDNNFELTSLEKIGLLLVNGVRFISFKPVIDLSSNKRNTILLQYAFYQERTRRYKDASDKYKELEKLLPNDSDEYAFVLLHDGFCLSMLGFNTEANFQLDKVYNLFPGTHYSENAKLLMNFLKESEQNKESLLSLKSNPVLYTKNLYLNGSYEDALKELERLPKLTKDLSFIKARSLEELGKTQIAIEEYIPLAKQNENQEIAIKANRRLLLLSNYYSENKELAKISEKNAINLGDRDAVKTIVESKEYKQETKVIQIIQSNDFNEPDLEKLKTEVKQELEIYSKSLDKIVSKELILTDDKEIKSNQTEVVPIEKLEVKNHEIFIPKSFEAMLSDGRIITANEIEFDSENGTAKILTANFPIKTPIDNLDTIRIAIPKGKTLNNPIKLTLKSGKTLTGRIVIFKSPKLKLEYSNKSEELKSELIPLKEINNLKLL